MSSIATVSSKLALDNHGQLIISFLIPMFFEKMRATSSFTYIMYLEKPVSSM